MMRHHDLGHGGAEPQEGHCKRDISGLDFHSGNEILNFGPVTRQSAALKLSTRCPD